MPGKEKKNKKKKTNFLAEPLAERPVTGRNPESFAEQLARRNMEHAKRHAEQEQKELFKNQKKSLKTELNILLKQQQNINVEYQKLSALPFADLALRMPENDYQFKRDLYDDGTHLANAGALINKITYLQDQIDTIVKEIEKIFFEINIEISRQGVLESFRYRCMILKNQVNNFLDLNSNYQETFEAYKALVESVNLVLEYYPTVFFDQLYNEQREQLANQIENDELELIELKRTRKGNEKEKEKEKEVSQKEERKEFFDEIEDDIDIYLAEFKKIRKEFKIISPHLPGQKKLSELEQLPAEILVNMADYLTPEEKTKLAMINKSMREIFISNYIFEREFIKYFPNFYQITLDRFKALMDRGENVDYFWYKQFVSYYAGLEYHKIPQQFMKLLFLISERDLEGIKKYLSEEKENFLAERKKTSDQDWQKFMERVVNVARAFGYQEILDYFYSKNFPFSQIDASEYQAMKWAVLCNQPVDEIKRILSNDLNKYINGRLHHAIKTKNIDLIKALIKAGALPNYDHAEAPLRSLVKSGDVYLTRLILDALPRNEAENNINEIYHGSNNLLHLACKSNNLEMVQMLLEHGADIDARQSWYRDSEEVVSYHHVFDGKTPLYIAVMKNNVELVELLLKNGADCNQEVNIKKTSKGKFDRFLWGDDAVKVSVRTPLEEAVEQNNEKLVQLMLQYRRRLSSSDELKYKTISRPKWGMFGSMTPSQQLLQKAAIENELFLVVQDAHCRKDDPKNLAETLLKWYISQPKSKHQSLHISEAKKILSAISALSNAEFTQEKFDTIMAFNGVHSKKIDPHGHFQTILDITKRAIAAYQASLNLRQS